LAEVRQNRSLTDATRLSARVRGKREVLGMVLRQAGQLVAVGIVLAAGWCGRSATAARKHRLWSAYEGPVSSVGRRSHSEGQFWRKDAVLDH
jgi:hypothetical protein